MSSDGGDCKYNTNTIYNILQEYARFKILFLDQFVGIEIICVIIWSQIVGQFSLRYTYFDTFAFSKVWQRLFSL